jgi:hypothetical protein
MKSHHTKAYTFASHTSLHTDQSLQKSMLFCHQKNKNFPPLKEELKHSTHNQQKRTLTMTTNSIMTAVSRHGRQERQPVTWAKIKWAESAKRNFFAF